MTTRRKMLVALGSGFLLRPLASLAQQQTTKIPRIGFLSSGSASFWVSRFEAFRQSMRELGYREGENIHIEYRYAEGKVDRLPELVAELVQLKVDIIVATSTPVVHAAKKGTSSIPILMTGSLDPVAMGLVASLSKPGGNVTGLSLMVTELAGKRLQLLREIFPKVSRIAVLAHGGDQAHPLFIKEAQQAAATFGMQIQPVVIRGTEEFDNAFATMVKARADAVIVQPILGPYAPRIAELAAKSRLLTISDANEFAEAGGLVFYGADRIALIRRLAVYVDKILKGAKPAELPVEQPRTYALVINLKTAKTLGVTIPQSVLLQANKVIE